MGRGAIVRDYAERVKLVELAWIPLRDGRRLAARLFLPSDAERNPVPAILEYIPYRRRDGTRGRDDETHIWFAANGYASARVDITGSGDSDGLLRDEYVKLEQDDACEIIAWLARQPWCSGAVGMIGKSWGGFNGLQVAARRPPALKAVISLCSTVDRYNDDVHFMGGCLLSDNMHWGGAFFLYAGLPPDPAMVGADWRKRWLERLEILQPFPSLWLQHQTRDAFWKHGSVGEDYTAIKCPVLAVTGWADGYTAAPFRLVENMTAPAKGIVGPWGHLYPHNGIPGPAIGFLQECNRWWDRWLKGKKNGVENDPALRLWLQDSVKPRAHYENRPGRWLAVGSWPSPEIGPETWYLNRGELSPRAGRAQALSIKSPQTTGLASGEWCAYGLGKVTPEMPLDQRKDDGGSLLFDSAPLGADLALVGSPNVTLVLRSDKPRAFVAVRLSDLAPDGAATRITYGLLNLTQRRSQERPEALVPGKQYRVRVRLKEAAYLVPKGHRLRVAISTCYWPQVVPSPAAATLSILAGRSTIELPILPKARMKRARGFQPAEKSRGGTTTSLKPGNDIRSINYDIEHDLTVVRVSQDDGWTRIDDIGTEVAYAGVKEFSIAGDDPLTARSLVSTSMHYRRGDWDARLETRIVMTCDAKHFIFSSEATASAGAKKIFSRTFKQKIKREHI